MGRKLSHREIKMARNTLNSFIIFINQENTIKTTLEFHFILFWMVKLTKQLTENAEEDVLKKELL